MVLLTVSAEKLENWRTEEIMSDISQKNFSYAGINYIKAFACISVLLVHFRHNLELLIPRTEYGFRTGIFMSIDYQLFVICVPLFFMCTGFLMVNKKFSYEYYVKFVKVLLLYFFCCLLTWLLLALFTHQEISLVSFWKGVVNFNFIEYAWYVKLYGILYLFIPLVNLIFSSLEKYKIVSGIIISLILLIIGIAPMLLSGFQNVTPTVIFMDHFSHY